MRTINNIHNSVISRISITLLLMLCFALHTNAQVNSGKDESDAEKNDTTEVEDNPWAVKKDGSIIPVDSARIKGMENYEKYVLDYRYLATGDKLDKGKWYKDMYIQMGLGAEKIVPPNDNYKFNTLTTWHVGFGKQFGPYHSLRLLGQCAIGYQQQKDRMYLRGGLQLDHSFDISSYVYGYNPARTLSVSTLFGVGVYKAYLRSLGKNETPYEMHAGLQLKFYTGPHGVVNMEPFIGLASDNIDLSGLSNWHRYDITYGMNMNMVYYFDNHLTRATRHRLINKSKTENPNDITNDSLHLYSWQKPWIYEFAGGPIFNDIPNMSLAETMGHEIALSIGKWFSPVLGIRGSVMIRHSDWAKRLVVNKDTHRTYDQRLSAFYVGGRVEAMVNPLGLLKNFSWEAPFGAYLVGGVGIGWLAKESYPKSLRCWSESYTAGVHLWYRLTDGLQLFLEPRYMRNVYNVPYTNKNWLLNFSDNSYGVNIGITASNIEKRYRRHVEHSDSSFSRIAVGLGAGTNLKMSHSRYIGNSPMNYNFNGFVEYRLSKVSAVRLNFAYFSHSTSDYSAFKDYNLDVPKAKPVTRSGLWHYTNTIGFLALNYDINLTNALCGYRSTGLKGGRLFNLNLFFGPGLAFHLNQKSELDQSENLRENHKAVTTIQPAKGKHPAVNGGVKLTAHITNHIGVTLTPQIYFTPTMENMNTVKIGRLRTFELVDLGVQYQF